MFLISNILLSLWVHDILSSADVFWITFLLVSFYPCLMLAVLQVKVNPWFILHVCGQSLKCLWVGLNQLWVSVHGDLAEIFEGSPHVDILSSSWVGQIF